MAGSYLGGGSGVWGDFPNSHRSSPIGCCLEVDLENAHQWRLRAALGGILDALRPPKACLCPNLP